MASTCSRHWPRTCSRSPQPRTPRWSSSESRLPQGRSWPTTCRPHPKATDHRSFSGTATTQAGALPPDILAAIVRTAIKAHHDPEVHRQTLAREEAERRAIRAALSRAEAGRPPSH
ncbi:hypothetical protein AB0B56_28265 [Streptosporangium canum]|uniref:hypothetical protein n=1 Tax=Streptosporangium canum TaxID=324952 RepID=UPI003426A869